MKDQILSVALLFLGGLVSAIVLWLIYSGVGILLFFALVDWLFSLVFCLFMFLWASGLWFLDFCVRNPVVGFLVFMLGLWVYILVKYLPECLRGGIQRCRKD